MGKAELMYQDDMTEKRPYTKAEAFIYMCGLLGVLRYCLLIIDDLQMTACVAQVCKPKDFAMQINLNMDNCWGIVRALVDLCLALEEGKYLLLKDPNKPLLRLYEIANDSFETNYSDEPIQDTEEAPSAMTIQEPAKEDEDEE